MYKKLSKKDYVYIFHEIPNKYEIDYNNINYF